MLAHGGSLASRHGGSCNPASTTEALREFCDTLEALLEALGAMEAALYAVLDPSLYA